MTELPTTSPLGSESQQRADDEPGDLGALLESYDDSLVALERAPRPTIERALQALLARDQLAQALAEVTPSQAEAHRIIDLDTRLRRLGDRLVRGVGVDQLQGLRASLRPSSEDWWWRLDEHVSGLEALLALMTGLALLLALVFSILSILQLSRVGANMADFSAVIGILLTLVTGSSLTGRAQKLFSEAMSAAHIAQSYQPFVRLGLAFAVMLFTLGYYLSLPGQAVALNNEAYSLRQRGELTAAIERYEQALRLSPSYAEAYYNLGDAYEAAVRYEDASEAYKQAYSLGQDPAVLNNLARLYLTVLDDPLAAFRLLDEPIRQLGSPADAARVVRPDTLYALYKNRGWAMLRLGLFHQAYDDLEHALAIRPDGSAAHCLLAQLAEHPDNPAADPALARSSWRSCLAYGATDYAPPEPEWMAIARERES